MILICLALFIILCFILLFALYELIKGGKDPNQGNEDRREGVIKLWKLYFFYLILAILLGSYLSDKGYNKIVNTFKNDESPITPYRR
jgi:hypothetical protein